MNSRVRALAITLVLLIANSSDLWAQDSLPSTTVGLATHQDTTPHPDDAENPASFPTAPLEVPVTPLPHGTRFVFTRDSLIWTSAMTLADLLTAVPGVYIVRGGFLGLPEYVVYAGRGAAALEVFWDGHQMAPLGRDSVYIDPSEIPLTYLRRVEIEVLPATLRVYLVSERHEAAEARSIVRIVTGDFGVGDFSGLFQRRWSRGLGFNAAADFLSTAGASGGGRSDQLSDVWLKIEWYPDSTTGTSYQFRRHSVASDPVLDLDGEVAILGRFGDRTDLLFTLFKTTSPNGRGLRFDAGVWISSWDDDSLDIQQDVRSAFAGVRYSGRRISGEFKTRVVDRWIENEFESRFGWTPISGVVFGADVRRRNYDDGRRSYRVHSSMALRRGAFSVVGDVTRARVVEVLNLPSDTGQVVDDLGVHASVHIEKFRGRVGFVRRDSYLPAPFPHLAVIASLDSTRATTYLEGGLSLRPASYLTVDGWFSNPRDEIPDFQPPKHTRLQVTFRSKFWRTFRSGAFDVKAQIAMDAWSSGTAGIDRQGEQIELPGITFYETYLEVQIVGFTIFWNIRNAYNSRDEYVPGLDYPRSAQTYGVRWVFAN